MRVLHEMKALCNHFINSSCTRKDKKRHVFSIYMFFKEPTYIFSFLVAQCTASTTQSYRCKTKATNSRNICLKPEAVCDDRVDCIEGDDEELCGM